MESLIINKGKRNMNKEKGLKQLRNPDFWDGNRDKGKTRPKPLPNENSASQRRKKK